MNNPHPLPAWWVYILECSDGSLYTGITTELERRVEEHNSSPKGARYTKSRRPVHLVYAKVCPNRSDALKEEIRIKRMARQEKLELIASSEVPASTQEAGAERPS